MGVARHPEPGDTVLGGDLQSFPGGKGANQAVAAAKAGGEVGMLGLVGSDAYGARLLESLADAGVDTRLIQEVEGPSGVALIAVADGGENTIIVSPGANGQLTPEHLSDEMFEGCCARIDATRGSPRNRSASCSGRTRAGCECDAQRRAHSRAIRRPHLQPHLSRPQRGGGGLFEAAQALRMNVQRWGRPRRCANAA